MPVEERKPLSVVSKLCYALSGMAQEMYWNVYGAYTNVFLVKVAQLPPLFGTSAVFGGRALDAVCNFILGPLIDRTDTRWGKLKPWILGAGVLLVPIYMLVWYVPDVGSEGKLAWYIFLYIFLMFAKTAFCVSSRTYVMLLSPDSQDRDSATAYRGLFSLIGITAGIAIHGQIAAVYGQGQADPCSVTNGTNNSVNNTNSTMDHAALAEEKTGYLISAGVISALTLACILAVIVGTTERRDILNTSGQPRDQSPIKMLRAVLTFRPNVVMLLITGCVQLTLAILLGAAVLYVQYGLDLPDQIHNTMLTFAVSAVLSIPAMGKVVARFGKKRPFMCYQLALAPSALGLLLIPSRSVASALINCAFLGLAGSSGFVLPWAMLNDVAEEYSLRTGRRLDTWFFSIALSTNSLCTTVGHGLTTIALEIGGYKTGECVQPDSVGSSLRILISVFPAAISLLCVGLVWKYPLTEDRRRQSKEELENRKTSSEEDPTRRWKESNGVVLHPGHGDVTGTIEEKTLLSPESDLSELVECRETVL